MKNDPIVIQRNFNAPVTKVWQAITDQEQMKLWYFDNIPEFKAEPGFITQFNVHHNGRDYLHIWKVTEAEPLKKISYEWKYGGYPGNSFVTFELTPEGDTTTLTLTHEGLETFLPDINPGVERKNFVEGWTAIIGMSLKKFVE